MKKSAVNMGTLASCQDDVACHPAFKDNVFDLGS